MHPLTLLTQIHATDATVAVGGPEADCDMQARFDCIDRAAFCLEPIAAGCFHLRL